MNVTRRQPHAAPLLAACLVATLVGCGGAATSGADARDGNAREVSTDGRDAGAHDATADVDAADADGDAAGDTTTATSDTAPPADAADGAPRSDGAVAESGSGDVAATVRTLTLVLQGAPWKAPSNSSAGGLAADANHRVYHIDETNVYMVDGATVSTYLTVQEAGSQVGLRSDGRFIDLDEGADGVLYVMLTATSMTANTAASSSRNRAAPTSRRCGAISRRTPPSA